MTVHLANGTALSLVARETAPAASTRDMFTNSSSLLGPRSAGVPGEVRGYWEAKQRLGSPHISWAQLVQPAIDLCEGGITVTAHAARALSRSQSKILADPGLRSGAVVFVTADIYISSQCPAQCSWTRGRGKFTRRERCTRTQCWGPHSGQTTFFFFWNFPHFFFFLNPSRSELLPGGSLRAGLRSSTPGRQPVTWSGTWRWPGG